MEKIAECVWLAATDFDGKADYIRNEVTKICDAHPIYEAKHSSGVSAFTSPNTWGCLRIIFRLIPSIRNEVTKICDAHPIYEG